MNADEKCREFLRQNNKFEITLSEAARVVYGQEEYIFLLSAMMDLLASDWLFVASLTPETGWFAYSPPAEKDAHE